MLFLNGLKSVTFKKHECTNKTFHSSNFTGRTFVYNFEGKLSGLFDVLIQYLLKLRNYDVCSDEYSLSLSRLVCGRSDEA